MKILFMNMKFKQEIIRLNTQEQLFKLGIDAQGEKLVSAFAHFGHVYSDYTMLLKEQKGQPIDRVTLKDSGDFYESFRVILEGDDIVITANTLKDDNDLIEVWGEDIIGLTEENLQIIIDKAREILIPYLREYLLAA